MEMPETERDFPQTYNHRSLGRLNKCQSAHNKKTERKISGRVGEGEGGRYESGGCSQLPVTNIKKNRLLF